jgi:hypothetical protein
VIFQSKSIATGDYSTSQETSFQYLFEQGSVFKSTFTELGFEDFEFKELIDLGILKQSRNGNYKLHFVGVLEPRMSPHNQALIVLPKYLKSNNLDRRELDSHLGLILNALKKYRNSRRQVEFDDTLIFPNNFGAESTNNLALADFFIRDFLNHGIYRKTKTTHTLNSNGRVDWKRTINKTIPVISGNSVVYTSTIHKKIEMTTDPLISVFQQYAVSTLIQAYGDVLGYSLHPNIAGTVENSRLIKQQVSQKRSSKLWQKLSKELRQTYGQRNLTLIRNLMNFIEPSYQSTNSMLIMGTKNFENLWEDVLLHYLDSEGVTSTINREFPVAKWWDLEHSTILNAPKGKPITDTVARVADNKYIIADAKYYNLEYDEKVRKFHGNGPGFNDIQKQIFYEKLLLSIKGDVECANMLIYPRYELENHDVLAPFGTVHIPISGLPFVVNFFGNAHLLLTYYTRSVSANVSNLESLYNISRSASLSAETHSKS